MARGDRTTGESRGPGLAIFSAFGVLCLAATLLVVWSTQDCSGMFGAPVATTPEPFAGAHAALAPLGSRDCARLGGPAVGPPRGVVGGAAARSRVEEVLAGRGYVAADGRWSGPEALPLEGPASSLEGSCGLVAVVAEPGGSVTRSRRGGEPWRDIDCGQVYALVPACDGDGWSAQGIGDGSVRSFVMPGLSPASAAATGVPLDVLLAHGEAEAQLRAMGWEPADEVVVRDVRATAASSISETAPSAPSSGCVGWVAVGRGLGNASTWWAHHQADSDPGLGGFTIGLVSCAPAPTALTTETRLDLFDHDGGGGRIWYRPYAPATGPSVPSGVATAPRGIASIRAVTAPPSPLPAPVPMQDPE